MSRLQCILVSKKGKYTTNKTTLWSKENKQKIKSIVLTPSIGLCYAPKKGVQKSKGIVIVFLPDRWEAQYKCLCHQTSRMEDYLVTGRGWFPKKFKKYMSDQAVLLSKWSPHWRIILAKYKPRHSYTFWTKVYYDIQPSRKFWKSPSSTTGCEFINFTIWRCTPILNRFWSFQLQHRKIVFLYYLEN